MKKDILNHSFKNTFLMKDAVRVIKDGRFQKDYFLLKKKPSIGCLFIHQDSAAVTRQPDGNLRVLQPGYHYLKNNEEMLLSFNLELQDFIYGPDKNDNPFEHKKSGENYTDFHARQLNAQKVRSYSKDSRACYPSFTISYQIGIDFHENADRTTDSILTIAKSLIKNNMSGEANNYINELLGKRAATLWADLLSDTTSDELFSESSDNSINHLIEKINRTMTASQSGNKEGTLSGEISGWQFNLMNIYLNGLKIQPDDQAKK